MVGALGTGWHVRLDQSATDPPSTWANVPDATLEPPTEAGVTDEAFLDAFERGEPPGGSFHHRDHTKVAWLYVRRDGAVRAERLTSGGLRRFARANNVPDLDHDTITRFWVKVVAHVVDERPEVADFDEFLLVWSGLADTTSFNRHYSAARIGTAAARAGRVEPDLPPMPG
jgi:hypothetical protein